MLEHLTFQVLRQGPEWDLTSEPAPGRGAAPSRKRYTFRQIRLKLGRIGFATEKLSLSTRRGSTNWQLWHARDPSIP